MPAVSRAKETKSTVPLRVKSIQERRLAGNSKGLVKTRQRFQIVSSHVLPRFGVQKGGVCHSVQSFGGLFHIRTILIDSRGHGRKASCQDVGHQRKTATTLAFSRSVREGNRGRELLQGIKNS